MMNRAQWEAAGWTIAHNIRVVLSSVHFEVNHTYSRRRHKDKIEFNPAWNWSIAIHFVDHWPTLISGDGDTPEECLAQLKAAVVKHELHQREVAPTDSKQMSAAAAEIGT